MENPGLKLDLKIILFIDNKYYHPTDFQTWSNHKPSQIKIFMQLFKISSDSTIYFYHVCQRDFLDENASYQDQNVGPLDTIVMTDSIDKGMVEVVAIMVSKMPKEQSDKFKNIESSKFDKLLENF